jgi:hypothetical protein
MKFRFQVICSKYHKGRLAITYDPYGNFDALSVVETENNYTTIVDISDKTDFEIEVGWGQTTAYREHVPLLQDIPSNGAVAQSTMFDTNVLNYTASSRTYGNGVLSVYVLNPLVVPDDTIDSDIQINVLVSMGDDFQVAAPTSEYLNKLMTSERLFPLDVVPQADVQLIDPAPPEEKERTDSAPKQAPVADRLGPWVEEACMNDLYFGENIVSLRQLLKRYVMCEIMAYQFSESQMGSTGSYVARVGREAMPFEPLWANGGNLTTFPLGTDNYVYAYLTPMRYFCLGYGGWRGSIRHTLDFSPHDQGRGFTGPPSVSWRETPCANYTNGSVATDFMKSGLSRQQYYGAFSDNEGMNGTSICNDTVNPLVSVEIPYFTEFKFAPAKQLPRIVDDVTTTINNTMGTQRGKTYYEIVQLMFAIGDTRDSTSPCAHNYVAAGEDFNLFYYLGPPVFYAQANYPQS